MEISAEISHCRYIFGLEFELISITDTDFGLETNGFCNHFGYNGKACSLSACSSEPKVVTLKICASKTWSLASTLPSCCVSTPRHVFTHLDEWRVCRSLKNYHVAPVVVLVSGNALVFSRKM